MMVVRRRVFLFGAVGAVGVGLKDAWGVAAAAGLGARRESGFCGRTRARRSTIWSARAFLAGLAEYGYREDDNLTIVWRYPESQTGADLAQLRARPACSAST